MTDTSAKQHDETAENPTYMRRIRSFVLREGRLTKGQQHALDNHWADYGVDYKQQQLNLALLGQQQQLLAHLNQQLQHKRQQDLSTLTALQRHNKEAMARVMERVLMMADSVSAGVGHD